MKYGDLKIKPLSEDAVARIIKATGTKPKPDFKSKQFAKELAKAAVIYDLKVVEDQKATLRQAEIHRKQIRKHAKRLWEALRDFHQDNRPGWERIVQNAQEDFARSIATISELRSVELADRLSKRQSQELLHAPKRDNHCADRREQIDQLDRRIATISERRPDGVFSNIDLMLGIIETWLSEKPGTGDLQASQLHRSDATQWIVAEELPRLLALHFGRKASFSSSVRTHEPAGPAIRFIEQCLLELRIVSVRTGNPLRPAGIVEYLKTSPHRATLGNE